MGRVARVPGTGLPRGQRRRRRRGGDGRGNRDRNRRRLVLMTWSAVFGVIALGALTVAVVVWMKQNMRRKPAVAEAGTPQLVIEERMASEFESPGEDEALDLVRNALAVRDPEQVSKYFRIGASSPEKVVDFLSSMAERDGPVEALNWLTSVDANGLLIDGVAVVTRTDGKFRDRLALLTPDESGVWRIDFDAFARMVKPSWKALLEEEAEKGLVRVVVAADHYFNGPFSDDSKWACYGMVSPDTEVMMLGYCRRGSPQERALERIVSDDGLLPGTVRPKRATLEVRRVEGADRRQFEITRVVAEDWVVSDKPFDSNFE